MTIKEKHTNMAKTIIKSKQDMLNKMPCDELMANKFINYNGDTIYASAMEFRSIDFWKSELLPTAYYLEA